MVENCGNRQQTDSPEAPVSKKPHLRSSPHHPRGSALSRIHIDWLIVGMLAALALATALPARGTTAQALGYASKGMLFLLFFAYGLKLSPRDTLRGLRNIKLHTTIATLTFLIYPLLGVALHQLTTPLLGPGLALGMLYLTLVPSTVQSSIAFTSEAHGNVPGAIVAASISNLLGVILTPMLVALTMATSGHLHISGHTIGAITLQILVPYLLGQALHSRWGGWIRRHPLISKGIDRGTIWLIVYTSFSAAIVGGVWQQVSPAQLGELTGLSLLLVGVVLALSWVVSGWMGFPRADRIAIQFCGSKKSLSTGVAMGTVIFAGVTGLNIGLLLLPLMVFHLWQLLLCSVLAAHYRRRWEKDSAASAGAGPRQENT